MRTEEAINHFGSQAALAAALGIKQPSVATWGEEVPALRQIQIEKITNGALKAATDVFKKRSAAHTSDDDADAERAAPNA